MSDHPQCDFKGCRHDGVYRIRQREGQPPLKEVACAEIHVRIARLNSRYEVLGEATDSSDGGFGS